MLSRGSLNLKEIVTSGESDPEKLQKLGNSVLGIGWNATTDTIIISLVGNPKNPKNVIIQNVEVDLTMRSCLSAMNCIYDPLCLVAPVSIRLRVAFRDLFRQDLDLKWDDPIPTEDMNTWNRLLQMLREEKFISYPRACKPANTVGKCQLICFFDGSDHAYAAVIYIRWSLT